MYEGTTAVKTRQMVSFWSVRRLSILLTTIALALFSYSLTQVRLNIGFYGLIHSLPITFIVSVGILTIASAILWMSKENHEKLLFVQLLFLIVALWLTAALLRSHPLLDYAYRNLGLINSIIKEGHVFYNWYLSWPGAHVLSAAVTVIGAINLEPILVIFPFFMQLLWLLPLYIFLRNVLGETRANYCWAGLWIFSLANWIGQEYFSPQAIAFFLLLTLLALITRPTIWKEQSYPLPFLLTAGFIIAGIAVIHLLTPLAIFFILIAFCVTKRAKKPAILIIACLVIVVVWDVTGGRNYTGQLLSQLGRPGDIVAFDPKYIVQQIIAMSFTGASSHIAIIQTRIIFAAIIIVLWLVGTVLALVKTRRNSTTISLSAMAIALLLLVPVAKLYGWELLHRLYFYSLPFVAYYGAMLLNLERKLPAIILSILLLIALPLHIVAHYGNATKDYIPHGEIAYWRFIQDNISQGYVTGGLSPELLERAGYERVAFEQLEWDDGRLVAKVFEKGYRPKYVNVGDWDRAVYEFLFDAPNFIPDMKARLDKSPYYNLIYSNPDLSLYISEARKP